ncbi:hypothetical protein ACFORO_25945 [Amycolatopsis halotolerans]|uniref:DUF2746 domain-containing protein n=1 Tax=Amycolatopsis halotolerans TaxID=330083 RepID=A0ABV7QPU0_9PSEU
MKDWIPVVVAFLGAGGVGVLLDLVRARKQAKKITAETELTDANAADKLTGAALKLVEPLTKQLQAAEDRCGRLNDQLQAAQAEVQQLRTQVELLTKDVAAKQSEIDRLRGGDA